MVLKVQPFDALLIIQLNQLDQYWWCHVFTLALAKTYLSWIYLNSHLIKIRFTGSSNSCHLKYWFFYCFFKYSRTLTSIEQMDSATFSPYRKATFLGWLVSINERQWVAVRLSSRDQIWNYRRYSEQFWPFGCDNDLTAEHFSIYFGWIR